MTDIGRFIVAKAGEREIPMIQPPARRLVPHFLLSLMLLVPASAANIASAAKDGADSLALTGGEALDRVVYAVDGAESSHGADPRMWRSEPNGPQGPMQISAAAAADVGGGDRFDATENRALGRAYLAHMYRRYGSWPDALAAYNWGPGRMNNWINGGRPIDRFPPAIARYRARMLFASGLPFAPGEAFDAPERLRISSLGIVHAQPRRPVADRHRFGKGPDPVELLYTEIMRATDPATRPDLK
jgi:hypothetical protein